MKNTGKCMKWNELTISTVLKLTTFSRKSRMKIMPSAVEIQMPNPISLPSMRSIRLLILPIYFNSFISYASILDLPSILEIRASISSNLRLSRVSFSLKSLLMALWLSLIIKITITNNIKSIHPTTWHLLDYLIFLFLYLKTTTADVALIDRHFVMRLDKARINAAAIRAADRRMPIIHYMFIISLLLENRKKLTGGPGGRNLYLDTRLFRISSM